MRAVVLAILAQVFLWFGASASFAQVQGQWTATGFMNSPRENNVQLPLTTGGALSVGGHGSTGTILASAEIYSPATGKWQLTGSLQTARETFAGVVLANGTVLVVGGIGSGGAVLGSAEVYDPATGAWTPAGTLTLPRYGHTATLLASGRVLVAGGCPASNCSTPTAVSELYDPATNAWTTTGSLGAARTGHTAVRLKSGKVMVIDGFAGGVTASCEIYDPSTGTWSAAASTNVAREQHGTTLLPDGKVLVTGGAISRFPMTSAELYDPVANAWTPTANMVAPRYAHTSTLLPDGTVLLAGGQGRSISCGKACTGFIPTASAEIFNEAAGMFTATTALNRALAYHSTTLLRNGRALTAGGEGYNAYCCQVLSDAEFYTPLTLTFSASTLSFGELQIGLRSPPQTITVSNLSHHASTFEGISASGDYAQTNACPITLGPGLTCSIMVTFAPTAAGTRKGAVTLKDNDPGSPAQTIALSGTGETTTLGLVPGSLSFGGVAVGSSAMLSATLVNDGAASVAIRSVAFSPPTGAYTQTNDCPTTLGVQESCTVSITFSPPDVFTYTANLAVKSSAGGATAVKMTGTGLDGGGGG